MSFRSVIDLIKYYTYVAWNLVFITVTYIESTGLLSLCYIRNLYFHLILQKYYQILPTWGQSEFQNHSCRVDRSAVCTQLSFQYWSKKIVDFFQFNRHFVNHLKTLSQSESWCPPLIHTKMNLIHMHIKFIFLRMVVYQALLCYWLVKIKFLN